MSVHISGRRHSKVVPEQLICAVNQVHVHMESLLELLTRLLERVISRIPKDTTVSGAPSLARLARFTRDNNLYGAVGANDHNGQVSRFQNGLSYKGNILGRL